MKSLSSTLLMIVSGCLLALSGCAPSGGDSSGETTLTGPIADLQGTWITGCLPDDGNYQSGTVTISGTSASLVGITYSDSACTTELSNDSRSFVFTIGDSIGFSDNSTGYKFTYSEENTTMFNVYKLVGNNLYFGSASSTSYPTTVSTTVFVKQ